MYSFFFDKQNEVCKLKLKYISITLNLIPKKVDKFKLANENMVDGLQPSLSECV